jgi:hypothetical protein
MTAMPHPVHFEISLVQLAVVLVALHSFNFRVPRAAAVPDNPFSAAGNCWNLIQHLASELEA